MSGVKKLDIIALKKLTDITKICKGIVIGKAIPEISVTTSFEAYFIKGHHPYPENLIKLKFNSSPLSFWVSPQK